MQSLWLRKPANGTSTDCIPWKTCDEGQYRSNGTTLTDATCKTCPIGRYQPKNAHTKETCLPWRTCEVGEKRVNGTNTSDASCMISNPFEGIQFQRYEDGSTEAVNADQPVAYPSFRTYVLDWSALEEGDYEGYKEFQNCSICGNNASLIVRFTGIRFVRSLQNHFIPVSIILGSIFATQHSH